MGMARHSEYCYSWQKISKIITSPNKVMTVGIVTKETSISCLEWISANSAALSAIGTCSGAIFALATTIMLIAMQYKIFKEDKRLKELELTAFLYEKRYSIYHCLLKYIGAADHIKKRTEIVTPTGSRINANDTIKIVLCYSKFHKDTYERDAIISCLMLAEENEKTVGQAKFFFKDKKIHDDCVKFVECINKFAQNDEIEYDAVVSAIESFEKNKTLEKIEKYLYIHEK